MITWMQTHKKWLIVTIWIATIAFVGAGFVGWGAYSYGKKQDEVAKVKDTPIKVKDIQAIYSQLFNQLNQAMGGKLDEATAKKFGLQKVAFQRALQKAMLIQFAKDNGIYVTDDDLAKNLIAIPAFQKNGKFDRALYNMFLQTQRMTAHEFETGLRKDISVEKLMKALNLPSTKTTQETFAGFMLMQDKVSIKTIKAPKITVTENEIKTYWQKHKDEYKSVLSYNIGYFYVPLDNNVTEAELSNYYDEHKDRYTNVNGEILSFDKAKNSVKQDLMAKKTKRDAIITMKKLKSGKMKFNKINNIDMNNQYISILNMQKLVQNQFLKPTLTKKGWLIAKLFATNQPTTLSYDKAKEFAKASLIAQKTKQTLLKLAKNDLNTFKGKNLGFIGKDDVMKLKSMSIDEANAFIQALFSSTNPKGFVLLPAKNPTKVVLFNITEQKLLNNSKFKKYKTMIVSYSDKLKDNEFNKNLMDQLEKLYQAQIKLYMKM